MNPAQILAIISLLLAFGVSQPTVDTVQTLLQADTSTEVTVPVDTSAPAPTDPVSQETPVTQTAPVIPSPTCTLTATTTPYSAFSDSLEVDWTTQNADSGSFTEGNGSYSTEFAMTPINAGSLMNIEVSANPSLLITASVTGEGGTGTCQTTI